MQAMPYFLEDCNADEATCSDLMSQDCLQKLNCKHHGMSGTERKRKVNELGLSWLLDLIDRVERAYSQVLIIVERN